MSVLIKGMEMPETCEKCRMNVAMFLFSDGPIRHCMLLKGRADKRKCPLVPVQTPHGRLIDVDAAIKHGWTINRTYSASPTENVYEVRALDFLPTIIEAEGEK